MNTEAVNNRKCLDGICALALLALIFYIPRQLFATNVSFHADEIILNYWSWRLDWHSLVHFLPTGQHDDRPMGWLFINLLYESFGFNYRIQLSAILLLHYLNSIVLYRVSNLIFNKQYISMIVVILYALNFPANSASFYIGAIFDLLCCLFMLLSIQFYIIACRKKFIINITYSLLFFYFSLRSKENTLLLPISLLIFDITLKWKNNIFSIRKNLVRNMPFLVLSALIAVFFFVRGKIGVPLVTSTDRYFMDFSIETCIMLFNHYFSLLTWIPEDKYPAGIFILLLALGVITRNRILLWSCSSFFLILFPVLFYKNRIPDIFLYTPNVFFAIIIGCLLDILCIKVNSNINKIIVVACVFFASILSFNSTKIYNKMNREIANRKSIGLLIDFMKINFKHVENNTKFFIANMPNFYNKQGKSWPLTNVLNLSFGDDTLSAFTGNSYENLYNDYLAAEGRRFFLSYNNGHVSMAHSSQ